MLPNIVRRRAGKLGHAPALLSLVALVFLLVGFARPQRTLDNVQGGAPTIVLTFDVSSSMSVDDVQPTRILAARNVALQLLHELPPSDRVAVVTFARKPRLLVAPTLNRHRVIAKLPKRVRALAQTAIGDGLTESLTVVLDAVGKSYPTSRHPSGAVLLLSDGGQNAGGTTPAEAANTAYLDGIPIDTIAVGTPTGILTQRVKADGLRFSNQIPVPVDATILRQISHETGGASFDAGTVAPSPAQLEPIFDTLRAHSAFGHRTDQLSAPLAGVALALMLAGIVLSRVWFGGVA